MSYQVPPSSEFLPCPRCGNYDVKRVRYTWWGGALGPSMTKLVKCSGCGYNYNGKTGASPKKFIVIYTLVLFVIAVLIAVLPQILN